MRLLGFLLWTAHLQLKRAFTVSRSKLQLYAFEHAALGIEELSDGKPGNSPAELRFHQQFGFGSADREIQTGVTRGQRFGRKTVELLASCTRTFRSLSID